MKGVDLVLTTITKYYRAAYECEVLHDICTKGTKEVFRKYNEMFLFGILSFLLFSRQTKAVIR